MQLFSIPSHIAGLMGMPRRVYTGEFQGVEAAQAWVPLVNLSAIGGVILFASAMCYVGVLVGTMLVMPRGERAPIAYAEPLVAPSIGPSLWDRLGLWTAVAVLLIALAYARPLYHLHTLARFPSQGFSPF
jgi:cytochrome c oxidase subunit 1